MPAWMYPLDWMFLFTIRQIKEEGLAVDSIARDDPSTIPGDDPSLAPAMRGKLGSEFET